MADAYDLLPYTEHAYAESTPDNLAVVAHLSGFRRQTRLTTDVPRVLELGCGRGGNLLPLASAWPETTFVGIDRSAEQIRDARRVAEATSLRNVTFVEADFTGRALDAEPFDFVLCHGVYSWIPAEHRPRLLLCIRQALAEDGVAYVSFNTYPGWHRRQAARDWMRFAARSGFAEGPRDALQWLRLALSPEQGAYARDLEAVHERLVETDAAYHTHEYLAEEHHPVYVTTLLSEAEDAGLAYLGDALPSATALELAPEAVRLQADRLDLAGKLALVDFARETTFRRALVVRADAAARSGFRAPDHLDPRALVDLRVASRLVRVGEAAPRGVETWGGAGMTVQLSGLAAKAAHALAEVAPRSLACKELAVLLDAAPEALAAELFDLWLATPGLDLHMHEPTLSASVSTHPRANAVARWHAIAGGPVTNVWQQEVVLQDAAVRFVLGAADGAASADDLSQRVQERSSGRLSEVDARALTLASLTLLARAALLVG